MVAWPPPWMDRPRGTRFRLRHQPAGPPGRSGRGSLHRARPRRSTRPSRRCSEPRPVASRTRSSNPARSPIGTPFDQAVAELPAGRRGRRARHRRLHASAGPAGPRRVFRGRSSTPTRRCCRRSPGCTGCGTRSPMASRSPGSPSSWSTRASTPGRSWRRRPSRSTATTMGSLRTRIQAVEHRLLPRSRSSAPRGRLEVDGRPCHDPERRSRRERGAARSGERSWRRSTRPGWWRWRPRSPRKALSSSPREGRRRC